MAKLAFIDNKYQCRRDRRNVPTCSPLAGRYEEARARLLSLPLAKDQTDPAEFKICKTSQEPSELWR